MTCPSCGTAGTGKFCSSCGASLAGAICPNCKSALTPGARFCHLCGTPLGRRASVSSLVPWLVAGFSVLALLVVLVMRRPGSPAPEVATGPAAQGPAPSAGTAPDISNMSPRERADRLFNRIMAAAERGDSAEMRFFRPMAMQAYSMLGTLDADARYHLALIQLVNGESAGATAQLDSIQQSAPNHLFVDIVRAELARRSGDRAARDRAYRAFLSQYDKELASGKPEYSEHRPTLDSFRQEAIKATGSTAPAAPKS